LALLDATDVFDNSGDIQPYVLKASIKNGKCNFSINPEPEWLTELLELVR
jgi:hypothetical protein